MDSSRCARARAVFIKIDSIDQYYFIRYVRMFYDLLMFILPIVILRLTRALTRCVCLHRFLFCNGNFIKAARSLSKLNHRCSFVTYFLFRSAVQLGSLFSSVVDSLAFSSRKTCKLTDLRRKILQRKRYLNMSQNIVRSSSSSFSLDARESRRIPCVYNVYNV